MKVYNKRDKDIPKDAVYVGRPSKWGNPFYVEEYGRDLAIQYYRDYLVSSGLINHVSELKGKSLVCYCAPQACHADVLMELANESSSN
jgi:hypothetical protein